MLPVAEARQLHRHVHGRDKGQHGQLGDLSPGQRRHMSRTLEL